MVLVTVIFFKMILSFRERQNPDQFLLQQGVCVSYRQIYCNKGANNGKALKQHLSVVYPREIFSISVIYYISFTPSQQICRSVFLNTDIDGLRQLKADGRKLSAFCDNHEHWSHLFYLHNVGYCQCCWHHAMWKFVSKTGLSSMSF